MGARTDRIEARLVPEIAEKIKQAAAITGTSASAFMVDAAADRAERILRTWRETVVPSEYFDQLLEALDEPPKVIPALAKAAERWKGTIKRR